MHVRSGKWETFIGAAILGLIVAAAPASAQEPDGATLYKQNCRACHGVKGVPSHQMLTFYPKLKPLADSGAFAKLPTDSVIAAMQKGRGTSMKPFAGVLTPEQMAAVATFIKTL